MKRLQGSKSVLGFLAGILLLVLMGSFQAQAAWTKSEKSRVSVLEKKVRALEAQLVGKSQVKKTIQFIAIKRDFLNSCPEDSNPAFNFPFSLGNGYSIPARISDYGNFDKTIQLILCETEFFVEE